MKTEGVYKLLHPDTTRDAVIRIQEANGTHAALKAIEEACVIACAALEKQMPKKPTYDGNGYSPDGTFVWDE